MACAKYLNSIQELIDGTIGSIRRAELEAHLDECADCRVLREDLQRIHDAAAALPVVEAPDRAWLQIAGRLRQEGRIHDTVRVAPARRSVGLWLAAAAALVIAVGSAIVLLVPRTQAPPQTAANAPAAAPVKSVEEAQNAVDVAQEKYEQAILELQKVAKANEEALDPTTSATIDKNLGILDQAIAENKAAVRTEPTSVAARETLLEAFQQKLSLLQDTIALINEMRKGNNAAAARMVNKS